MSDNVAWVIVASMIVIGSTVYYTATLFAPKECAKVEAHAK